MDQASGYMNLMKPNNRMYGQYGNRMYGQYGSRAGADFGSYAYNSWTNGRGWVVVDNKYKSRGHGYGNENRDGLNELIEDRGPRVSGTTRNLELSQKQQRGRTSHCPIVICPKSQKGNSTIRKTFLKNTPMQSSLLLNHSVRMMSTKASNIVCGQAHLMGIRSWMLHINRPKRILVIVLYFCYSQ